MPPGTSSQPLALVTGASGFVGRALVPALAAEGRRVRAASRHPLAPTQAGVESAILPDLSRPADWRPLLDGAEAVVHCAGIAHASASDEAYERVNHRATAELAEAAAEAGIARFVFLSSIRAQAGASAPLPLTEIDPPAPTDAYGRSKLAGEQAIGQTALPFVILRPAVVYGPRAKGNVASLFRLARWPGPLPFGAFSNRRSLLAMPNLVRAISFALHAPNAVRETFLVADEEALSVAAMLGTVQTAIRGHARLLPLPPALIRSGLSLLGRSALWERLGEELVVDPGKLIRAGWRPPVNVREALFEAARAA